MGETIRLLLPTVGAGLATFVCWMEGSMTVAVVGGFVTGFGTAMTLVTAVKAGYRREDAP